MNYRKLYEDVYREAVSAPLKQQIIAQLKYMDKDTHNFHDELSAALSTIGSTVINSHDDLIAVVTAVCKKLFEEELGGKTLPMKVAYVVLIYVLWDTDSWEYVTDEYLGSYRESRIREATIDPKLAIGGTLLAAALYIGGCFGIDAGYHYKDYHNCSNEVCKTYERVIQAPAVTKRYKGSDGEWHTTIDMNGVMRRFKWSDYQKGVRDYHKGDHSDIDLEHELVGSSGSDLGSGIYALAGDKSAHDLLDYDEDGNIINVTQNEDNHVAKSVGRALLGDY